MFCREDGALLHGRKCESKSKEIKHGGPLAKGVPQAGLRRVGWHALRHTCADRRWAAAELLDKEPPAWLGGEGRAENLMRAR